MKRWLLVCLLAACGAQPTRAQIESAQDKACADIAKVRAFERDLGINGPDAGEAGARP
jgi:hypothetical protein